MNVEDVVTVSDDSLDELPAVELAGLSSERIHDLSYSEESERVHEVSWRRRGGSPSRQQYLGCVSPGSEAAGRQPREESPACAPGEQLDADALFDLMFSAAPAAPAAGSTPSYAVTSASDRPNGGVEKRRKQRADGRSGSEGRRRAEEGERAARRARAALHDAYRPARCMQHMRVEAHPALLGAWYASDVPRELAAARVALAPAPALPHAGLLLFSRCIRDQVEYGERALLVLPAAQAAELVSRRALATHVASAAAAAPARTALTLLLLAARHYFKSGSRKAANGATHMTEVELEMAITDVVVSAAGADVARAETASELALFIVHFTKAVAEQPYKSRKRESDERAEFYMRGDKRQCVAVAGDGVGLGEVWQQMLAVLPQSSLEVARAVRSRYPSPLQLYRECAEEGGRRRLAEVGVLRAAAADARARSLGAEFSRKLSALLTADCGDQLLT